MIRPALRATALCVLLLAVIWAIPGFAISKEFNQAYPLQPGGSVELQNVNGTADVQGWDRSEIEDHPLKTPNHKHPHLHRTSPPVPPNPTPIPIPPPHPP